MTFSRWLVLFIALLAGAGAVIVAGGACWLQKPALLPPDDALTALVQFRTP